jgi:hypothetical protein
LSSNRFIMIAKSKLGKESVRDMYKVYYYI